MTIGTKDPLMQRFVKAVRRLRAYSSVGTPGPTQLVPVISASGTEAIGSMALSDIATQGGAALLTGNQTVAGIKTFSSMFRIPVGANVVAIGSDQAGAAVLLEGAQAVSGADGSVGVRLPVAAIGAVVIIKGITAGVLKVYPDTGAGINAVGTNTAMSLASGVIPVLFWKHTATQWYTLPLLPS